MFKQTYLSNPESIVAEFVKSWNKRDAVALANLFVENAEFVNVVGLWWHSREAIWKAHDYGLTVIFKNSHLESRKSTVRLITDRVALVHARMKLSGQTAFGSVKTPGIRKNLFSFVLEKKEQGWVCISAHNTDIVPGKETNLVDEKGNMHAMDYRLPSSD